jgi:cytoskeleton protein RodZ
MRPRQRVALARGKLLVWCLALLAVAVLTVYGLPALQRLWSARTAEPVSDQLLIPLPGSEDVAGAGQADGVAAEPSAAQVETPVEIPSGQAVAIEEMLQGEAAVSSEAESEPAVEPQPVAEPEAAPDDAAGPAVIQLRFVEDSWVEMEANGRKLVVGTQRAGSERTVSAEPPVQLLLGNAPGVEITFRGKAVDLGSLKRGKVARLILED